MSKKNGKLFSKALFGYKCKNVHEYIRNTDEEHANELSRVQAEKAQLQDKLTDVEYRLRTAEERIKLDALTAQKQIKDLTADYEARISLLNASLDSYKEKLIDSEGRASSYIKLIDSSNAKAESAEAELTVLSATLDDYKSEIDLLKQKLAEKEIEIKRVSDFEKLTKKLIESNQEEKQSVLQSIVSLFKKNKR